MMEKLRQVILKLNVASERRQSVELGRKALAMAAKLTRSSPDKAAEKLAGLATTIQMHEAEVATWVPSSALAAGEGGAFDTCDLRHWLALAERAGVPYVPAKEIVSLDDEETSFLSGVVPVPEGRTRESVATRLRAMAVMKEAIAEADGVPPNPEIDVEALDERLTAAMDGVPEGWMVRSARCGGSELKALAGFGAGGPTIPETRFGPELEVGPGWVRLGNRRRVHVGDMRTIEAHAQGPGGPLVFLARPWVEAARYAVGEDPHRHGSQFAGKGIWPAEWRAFVEGDVVVGVASYYGWCGSVTQENAKVALEVRDLAQRIVDEAVRQKAYPRYMDVEFMRSNGHPQVKANERIQAALSLFARDKVGCTLDFIETAQGPTLLEGGPPNTPFGGGHPCAFAGSGGPPRHGNKTNVHGVAFRIMPGVILADPSTWEESDREDSILDWGSRRGARVGNADAMTRFVAHVPDVLYHGTATPDFLSRGVPPASECGWWSRSAWPAHDRRMSGMSIGDDQIPYANIVWEQLGLREAGRPNVPEWARGIRSFEDLASSIGMVFATDDERHALRYGEVHEIELSSEDILDVAEDPHIRTARAWILLVRANAAFPILRPGGPVP